MSLKKIIKISILAVVLVAICLFIIDKFKSKKYEFEQTMLTIVDFQDMATLYVAKYYGEVINSTTDEILSLKKQILENIQLLVNDLKDIKIPENEKDKLSYAFQEARKILKSKYGNDDIANLAEKRIEVRCLLEGYRLIRKIYLFDIADYLLKNMLNEIVVKRNELEDEVMEAIKKEVMESRNKDIESIAYLARGSVNIGLDLKEVKISIDKKNGKNFLKFEPTLVVRCLINPMFMVVSTDKTEKTIYRGYELIRSENPRFTPQTSELMKKVKRGCKVKLVEYALKDGIIKKSLEYGQQILKGFVSLFYQIAIDNETILTQNIDGIKIVIDESKVKILPEKLENQSLSDGKKLKDLLIAKLKECFNH